jgi:O-antigen/teichoic acid export membrane protein
VSWLPALAGRTRAAVRGPAATTTAANAVVLLGAALAGVVSARALGPAGRGQLAIAVLWSALIYLVGSTGLQSSFSYHLARWPGRRAALASWLRRIAARQALAMTAVSTGVMWWLHLRLGLPALLTAEYTTWAAAGAMALYGAAYAQGCHDFARMNATRMLSGAAPAVLMITGAVALRLTPAEAGAAYLIPTWCSAALGGIWLRRAGRAPAGPRLAAGELRAVWSYGWRSLASLSGLTLNTSSDQFTLGLLLPAGSLGVYSVAASASSPLPYLLASLGMVGLPGVSALAGPAKATAARGTLRRAAKMLAVTAVPLAAVVPWAIPEVYGDKYAGAVLPAEVLLSGAVFAALATITDDLLRAYGHPGFVSVTQGAGGVVTVTGILLVAGHSLTTVAFVSSLGFAVAFALALGRLRAAMRRLALGTGIPDRVSDDLLPDADQRVCGDIEVHHASGANHRVRADPAGAHDNRPARDPGTRPDHDAPVQLLAGHLALRPGQPEVVGTGQQHDVMAEEHIVADVHEPAKGVYQDIGEAGGCADPDP